MRFGSERRPARERIPDEMHTRGLSRKRARETHACRQGGTSWQGRAGRWHRHLLHIRLVSEVARSLLEDGVVKWEPVSKRPHHLELVQQAVFVVIGLVVLGGQPRPALRLLDMCAIGCEIARKKAETVH